MRITLIGAGNLATHLGKALADAGNTIEQVYSRTMQSATRLAALLGCEAQTEIGNINTDSDVYVLSVSDSALPQIVPQLCAGRDGGIFVHTAGSIPADIFRRHARHYGVVYPMQTFSKEAILDFRKIPCFIEASDDGTLGVLQTMCREISDSVVPLGSDDRKYLHLAAVFASNFVNHCYNVASHIMRSHGIPFEYMYPLIDEVASKIHSMPPSDAQTGPAVRNDRNVIDRHLSLLSDEPEFREIYGIMSDGIHKIRNKS